MIFASGCANRSEVRIEYVAPPGEWLRGCHVNADPATVGELLDIIPELLAALAACNADAAALRRWRATVSSGAHEAPPHGMPGGKIRREIVPP